MTVPQAELADVCEKVTVGHVGTTTKYYTDSKGVPFLRTQNVTASGIDTKDLKYITPEFHHKLKKSTLAEGDVVLSRVVSTRINCGVVPESLHGSNCANIIVARPDKDKLDATYLLHYLKSDSAQRALMKQQVGSAQSVVNTSVLKSWRIPLPTLGEQKRIAALLEKADSIRRKRQHAIELAGQFLQSVFLEMFGDPAENPKGWEVVPMGSAIKFRGGSQPNKKHFIDHYRDGYVRLIQIRDFKSDSYPTYIPEDLAKRRFEHDDVMIARYGPPVFQILRGLSGSYNVALMKAEPISDAVTKDFVFHLLQTPRLHDFVVANSERTAGQSGVNLELLNNYPLPLPPIEVQDKFTEVIRFAEKTIKTSGHQLELSKEFVGAIAQNVFEGNAANLP